MLLEELINTRQRKRAVDFSKAKNDMVSDGRGTFGKVKHDKADPHMTNKIPKFSSKTLESDGYYQWIKAVVDSKGANHNPWLPRVYDIVILNDASDNHEKYRIKMERLIPIYNVSISDLMHVLRQIDPKSAEYLDTSYKKEIETAIHYHDGDNYIMHENLQDSLVEAVKGVYFGRLQTPDENLEAAIDLMKNVIQKGQKWGFSEDIAERNILVRRMSRGIQCVLVDPVFENY